MFTYWQRYWLYTDYATEISNIIAQEYEVSNEEVYSDIVDFLRQLNSVVEITQTEIKDIISEKHMEKI
ncbi:PqqD family peptide modification chaperone [Paenibacillus alvei]|uniref:PqqD family peptide modification chaperone n=1 Tax=Paenibacillus TaxID=44249 RepID=UPI00398FA054